jgi:hypothetical protein
MLRSFPGPPRSSRRSPTVGRGVCPNPRVLWRRWFVTLMVVACAVSSAMGQASGCATAVQGALPAGTYTANRVVTLSVDCGPGSFETINWGDGTGTISGNSPLIANHTYPAGAKAQPPYGVLLNEEAILLFVTFPTAVGPFSSFSGQASTVTSPITADEPLSLIVVCQSVFDASGNVFTPQQLNVTCTSPDLPAMVPQFPASLPVRVVVATSGIAKLEKQRGFRSGIVFACLMLPLFGAMGGTCGRKLGRIRSLLAMGALLSLALSSISCGGGFTTPKVGSITPAGQYQVVAVTQQSPGTTPDPNFVQTTLIVPLTVAPTQ